jgi:hypothetical protein
LPIRRFAHFKTDKMPHRHNDEEQSGLSRQIKRIAPDGAINDRLRMLAEQAGAL